MKNNKKANSSQYLWNNKIMPKSKRSQSETVGFVLIIIIVMVIMLILLYFLFRPKPATTTDSADMTFLLDSFNEYTTNCTFIPDLPQYENGKDLIQECYSNEGELCTDGRSVCQVLNDTIKEVIGRTLDVGEDYKNKAYRINIKYFVKGSKDQNITKFSMQEGTFANCTERYGGYSIVSESPGALEVRLEVCKGKNGK